MNNAIYRHYHREIKSIEEAEAYLPKLFNELRPAYAMVCWNVMSQYDQMADSDHERQLHEHFCEKVRFTPDESGALQSEFQATCNNEDLDFPRALYDLESHEMRFVSELGSHWPDLKCDLAEQLARAAIYALHKVDACAGLCRSSNYLQLHEKLVVRLECALQQTAGLDFKDFQPKAPQAVGADDITRTCHISGGCSSSFNEFLQLVFHQLRGKVEILDLIQVIPLWSYDQEVIYGAGLAGAKNIRQHLQQPNSMLAFRLDLLPHWLPLKFVEMAMAAAMASRDPQEELTPEDIISMKVGICGEMLAALFVVLLHCAKGVSELVIPLPAHKECGDHADVLVWSHEGLSLYEVKSSLHPPRTRQIIEAKLSACGHRLSLSKQQLFSLVRIFNVPLPEHARDNGHALPRKTVMVMARGPTVNPRINVEFRPGDASQKIKPAYITKMGWLLE